MEPHDIFEHILSLTSFSDDELVRFALSRTGFQDTAGLGVSYPDSESPEEEAIPPCSVRATCRENGERQVIVDEWEYLKALERYFLAKGDKEKAAQINACVLTLKGFSPQGLA